MNIIFVLLPVSLLLGLFFLIAYIWSVRNRQYDDTQTPAFRILIDENTKETNKWSK